MFHTIACPNRIHKKQPKELKHGEIVRVRAPRRHFSPERGHPGAQHQVQGFVAFLERHVSE